MRKLMWLTLGFAAACFAGAYLFYGHWLLTLTLSLPLGMLIWVFQKEKRRKIFALIFLGFCTGIVWQWGFDGVVLKPVRNLDGSEIKLTAVVSDYSYFSRFGCAAECRVKIDGRSYRSKLYLDDKISLNPGDQVTDTFSLRYTGPGDEKNKTYYESKGIFLLLFSEDSETVKKADSVPARFYPAMLRRQITELIDTIFPEATSGFARALLLGDTRNLPENVDADLRTSGIRHIVAVSGLHVSILFMLIYTLCGKKRFLTATLSIPLLCLFAAVTGFSPSIVRACVMQSLMILAMLLDREYDPPTALAFAVLILLGMNPLTVFSIGFQLSVGCVAGVFLVSERIRQYLLDKNRMGRWSGKSKMGRFCHFIAASVSVTLGAMLLTAPLCGYYFGSVSLVGIVTNLLTLWVVTLIFYGVIVSCILGALWLPLGKIAAYIVSGPVYYCLFTAHILSKIPFAAIYIDGIYMVLWLLFSYILLAVFLSASKKYPAILASCVCGTLCAALLLSWLEPRLDDFRVHVLDVGQGQCVLLQCRNKAYLVDCGGDREGKAAEIAIQNMKSQGITRLDGLILTHYDGDHVNGTDGLMARFHVDNLYLPDTYDENGFREQIETKYEKQITWVHEITKLKIPEGTLTIVPSHSGETDNDSGLCVLFQPAGYDILITGDRGFSGERELMEDMDLPKLELLVAGHHGSRFSSGWEFLKKTHPQAVAISAGEGNNYGHPSDETLERFKIMKSEVYRTDLDGTIRFRG